MPSMQIIPWTDPLTLAATIREDNWVLLYSAARTSYSGRFSYIACALRETVSGSDFHALSTRLSHDRAWHENAWFGYLGYGLKNNLEVLPQDAKGTLALPDMQMSRYGRIYQFDHDTQTLRLWSDGQDAPLHAMHYADALPPILNFSSNMTNAEYKQHVSDLLKAIHAGDVYQVNLTRKFHGHFATPPDSFSLFSRLCAVSPAPYSAYIRMNNAAVISSSPELFLRIDNAGSITARPIKGTSPRFADPKADQQSKQKLAGSEKDKAENLMIVDLMRNDLARSCPPGSVMVQDLFDISSHSNVHHMASTITGKIRNGCSTIDVVQHCFPPGSMTGAPKIKAMQLCTEHEKLARGIYSGAIGFFDGGGGCELSVVIRTLITEGNYFEFQVGGGIVADSTPDDELQETFHKARGILDALAIPLSELENL